MYRSRLQKVEENKNLKKAIWLIAGTLLFLVAAVVWGVPLLVRLAVFLGDVNSSRRPVDKADIIPPPPPVLLSTYDATNSATLALFGRTEPGVTVYLTQNEQTTMNVVSTENGEFRIADLQLKDGQNTFVAVAIDASGNKSLTSNVVTVLYLTKQPQLDVSSPSDRQIFSGSNANIEVKGQTDPESRLTINDRVIVVNGDGRFLSKYKLNSGENTLIIISTDHAGNQARKELVVSYNP